MAALFVPRGSPARRLCGERTGASARADDPAPLHGPPPLSSPSQTPPLAALLCRARWAAAASGSILFWFTRHKIPPARVHACRRYDGSQSLGIPRVVEPQRVPERDLGGCRGPWRSVRSRRRAREQGAVQVRVLPIALRSKPRRKKELAALHFPQNKFINSQPA